MMSSPPNPLNSNTSYLRGSTAQKKKKNSLVNIKIRNLVRPNAKRFLFFDCRQNVLRCIENKVHTKIEI